MTDTKFYIECLKSDQCLCEKAKEPGRSFCYRCYKALPVEMQKDLWQKFSFGYEEAFEEAAKWLQESVW